MFKAIRRRFTYANVAATLALVFAMTGGAYAANKFLITSTKQISPKVLKSLKGSSGKAGANGAQGAAGAAGPQGPTGPAGGVGTAGTAGAQGIQGVQGEKGKEGKTGKEGSPWTVGGTLPSGKTETGAWGFGPLATTGHTQAFETVASFPIPLAEPLGSTGVHYINYKAEEVVGEGNPNQPSTACKGTVAKPTAEPGNLCVYAAEAVIAAHTIETSSSSIFSLAFEAGAGTTGALATFSPLENGSEAFGTWAVTAP